MTEVPVYHMPDGRRIVESQWHSDFWKEEQKRIRAAMDQIEGWLSGNHPLTDDTCQCPSCRSDLNNIIPCEKDTGHG